MFRLTVRAVCYVPNDVRSKIIFSKAVSAKVKQGIREEDIDRKKLAQEIGLLPPDTMETSELVKKREKLLEMLEAQKMKRIARKEAFLTWQAGQREKGAAHRLVRQSQTAEKSKRHHYHSQKGHIISVAHHSEDGGSTNQSSWSPTNNAELLVGKEPTTISSYLSGEKDTILLTLSKK